MLATETAGLAISMARGIIKGAGRMDGLMAEKIAVQEDIVLPMPTFEAGVSKIKMKKELSAFIKKDITPDPISDIRDDLESLLSQSSPPLNDLIDYYEKVFPDRVFQKLSEKNSTFLEKLQLAFPDRDFSDVDTQMAVMGIAAGRNKQQIGYAYRLGLVVVDVVTELGAENTGLLIKDKAGADLTAKVLSRFSKPDLAGFDTWGPFLKHALSATLHGALDAQSSLNRLTGDSQWLDAVLGALSTARTDSGDDFVIGLFNGEGYGRLVGELMTQSANVLIDSDSSVFEKIAGDFLVSSAAIVKNGSNKLNKTRFFQAYWGDFLRAGLQSVQKNGPQIMAGAGVDDESLLGQSMATVMETMIKGEPWKRPLSSELIYDLSDAMLGMVANNPDLITGGVGNDALKQLMNGVIKTADDQGVKQTLSPDGLQGLLRTVVSHVGQQPQLIVRNPGMLQDIVGGVAGSLKDLKLNRFDGTQIASSAVKGALIAISENPRLDQKIYGRIVAELAGHVGGLVGEKSLTGIDAADLVQASIKSVTDNATLYLKQSELPPAIMGAILKATESGDIAMVGGKLVLPVIEGIFDVLSLRAQSALDRVNGDLAQFSLELTTLIEEGLKRAEGELGKRLNQRSLSPTLAGLVDYWSRGQIAEVSADADSFKQLFAKLAEKASQSYLVATSE